LKRTVFFLAVLAGAAGLLIACNGDGDGEPTPLPAGFVQTPPSDATPATPSVFDDAEIPDDEDLSAPARELVGLLTSGLTATYAVTYMTASPEGEEGDMYAVFNDGSLGRVDLVSPAGEPTLVIVAQFGGNVAECVPASEGWRCAALERFGGHVASDLGPVIFPGVDDVLLLDVEETEGRVIAGQQARCFAVSDPDVPDAGALDYCLNDVGVVLYNAGNFGSVEATGYADAVPEGTFALPPA
jgi:hypothetical protein